MTKVVSFEEALNDSEQYSKRHLLLGNGFSIACCPDIFHYGSLFEKADFSNIPEAKKVFDALNTHDFEVVIKALENSAKIFPIYTPNDSKENAIILRHAAELKELLITTIAGNHPPNPNAIEKHAFQACRKFLSYFLSPDKKGHVFTINYDLLLYWVLMHDDEPANEGVPLKVNDSFGNDENDPNADYVVWQGETAAYTANIYFLHGALHLFDSGSELQKYTWIRRSTPLVDQARTAIEQNKFPLFVSEGSSIHKKNKIRHNAYLYQGFKVLTSNTGIKTHCFFVFGHSLAENDDHILMRLGKGKFKTMYVSIYGDPESQENKMIISRANKLAMRRHEKCPLNIVFFDSSSAKVWGES